MEAMLGPRTCSAFPRGRVGARTGCLRAERGLFSRGRRCQRQLLSYADMIPHWDGWRVTLDRRRQGQFHRRRYRQHDPSLRGWVHQLQLLAPGARRALAGRSPTRGRAGHSLIVVPRCGGRASCLLDQSLMMRYNACVFIDTGTLSMMISTARPVLLKRFGKHAGRVLGMMSKSAYRGFQSRSATCYI